MSGQVGRIFITGGASGLGRALAERYARDGWRVCIGDLDTARCEDAMATIREYAPASHALTCDVTREADLHAVAEWLQREEGGFPPETRFNSPEGETKWREWFDENLRICALAQEQARAAIAKATGAPA